MVHRSAFQRVLVVQICFQVFKLISGCVGFIPTSLLRNGPLEEFVQRKAKTCGGAINPSSGRIVDP